MFWLMNLGFAGGSSAPAPLTGDMIQSLQQAGFRGIGGTTGTYNEDAIAAFRVDLANDDGSYDELLIKWLQQRLTSTTTNLDDLKAEAAVDRGVSKWQEITDVENIGT